MAAIIKLDAMHHEILRITMDKAVAVLQPGAIPMAKGDLVTTWRHPASDDMVEIVNQGGIKVYVAPVDAVDKGVLIRTGPRHLADGDIDGQAAILDHLTWMQDVVASAEPVDGPLWNHNQALVEAIAGVCALHPDAKRASNVDLTAESHERGWSLHAMSNVERVEIHPDLVAWVRERTTPAETINDYYGEDYMFTVSVWKGYPREMDEARARETVAILPERLRDGVVSVSAR